VQPEQPPPDALDDRLDPMGVFLSSTRARFNHRAEWSPRGSCTTTVLRYAECVENVSP